MFGLDHATTLRILITLGISAGLTILLGAVAVVFPKLGDHVFRRTEQVLSRFAQRKTLAVCVVFLGVVALRVLALPFLPVPVPGIHDEQSYLLMSDTFAHGRLANPPHPMWVSFETFHVNWVPTYSSMYPPAQGFALALGQLLGHPWIGVLLSIATMCAAILWMLQAWMPARWALLGAALAALKFGVAGYWMNSYWGGAVAATGGALALGALARIVKRASVGNALLLGLGVAILANSRPYEGFLFCLPAALWFLSWLIGRSESKDPLLTRFRQGLAPLTAVLVLAVAFMGYYNWRLTGNPLLFPHTLNMRTYHSTGLFLWDPQAAEKQYRNAQFEDFYNGWARDHYQNTWHGVWRVTQEKIVRCAFAYFWIGMLLAIPAFPFIVRDRKMRLLWITLGLGGVGVFVVIWSNAHYAAPFTVIVVAVWVQSIRHLRTMNFRGRLVGIAVSRAIVVLLMLDASISVVRGVCDPLIWPCQGDPSRTAIAERLAQMPGKHLVLVRYDEDHNIHDEWVYNGAEIDGAKVLWARELDSQQNARLFAYFKDRHIWLVIPDMNNEYLEPYTPPNSPLISEEQLERTAKTRMAMAKPDQERRIRSRSPNYGLSFEFSPGVPTNP